MLMFAVFIYFKILYNGMNNNVKIHTKCFVSTTFWGRMNSHSDVRDAVSTGRMILYFYDHYQAGPSGRAV